MAFPAQDFRFTFKLRCKSCKAEKQLRMAAYPFEQGSVLPPSYGEDAACLRCKRSEMEFISVPPQEPPPPPPIGWVTDPRDKE